LSRLQNRAGNLLRGEPLDGAGNLGSGSVGDIRPTDSSFLNFCQTVVSS